MTRIVSYKIYLSSSHQRKLNGWMRLCSGVYNKALEQRKKAFVRRKENVSLYDQQKLVTEKRARIPVLREVPVHFQRDALRRVDKGFKGFFRRLKT